MSGFEEKRILLIGAGRMGGALLSGWLDRGLKADRVVVVDPSPPPETSELLARWKISPTPLDQVAPPFDVVLLAVKPQTMAGVLPTVADLTQGALTISIAAGTPIAAFEAGLGTGRAILRAMPNTPAAIGEGMSVLCANAAVSEDQRALGEALLSAVGSVAWIDDEADMDAVTAVSGSGPAYIFLLAECLAEAGEKAGLQKGLATFLARRTIAGAGALLGRSNDPAEILRRNVTSPGGTTAAALEVLMDEDRMKTMFAEAVAAAARRSRELK